MRSYLQPLALLCLTCVEYVFRLSLMNTLPRVRFLSPVARRLQLRKVAAAEAARMRFNLTMQMVRA